MDECHPKYGLVRQLVEEHLEKHPDERILIFSEYRDTVDHRRRFESDSRGTSRSIHCPKQARKARGMTQSNNLKA